MATQTIPNDVQVNGSVVVTGTLNVQTASIDESDLKVGTAIPRSKLAQDTFAEHAVPFTDMRVHDDLASLLPGTAAADDLALVTGTFGTDAPSVEAGDMGGASITRRAALLYTLPPHYDDNESVRVMIRAAMQTTVADSSCTVDVEAYELDDDNGLEGSPTDLCQTAAQDINSLTWADKTFTLDASNLTTGSQLVIRITISATDSGDAGEMIPTISKLAMQLDIKG